MRKWALRSDLCATGEQGSPPGNRVPSLMQNTGHKRSRDAGGDPMTGQPTGNQALKSELTASPQHTPAAGHSSAAPSDTG